MWAWAGTLFGLQWLGLPLIDLLDTDPPAWEIALVVVALLAFASQFLVAVMTRLLAPVLAMLVISVVLTLAVLDSFALGFVFAASAASVRLDGRDSALAVAGITAIAAGTLALTDPDGAVFWGITGTVFATGTLWLLIGGLIRSNAARRRRRWRCSTSAEDRGWL